LKRQLTASNCIHWVYQKKWTTFCYGFSWWL